MTYTFSQNLIQAINNWQCDNVHMKNVKNGTILKQQCLSLPKKFRIYKDSCFRRIDLCENGVWRLIGDECLTEKISSWTTDIDVAKGHYGGVPPKEDGYLGLIICVKPCPDDIIVNLQELYNDKIFNEALNRDKGNIKNFSFGIGQYGNREKEIVLEIADVASENICSIGGHTSPFDDLVNEAAKLAKEISGYPATQEDHDTFHKDASLALHKAGPNWLNFTDTRRILNELQPGIKQLVDIKNLQEMLQKLNIFKAATK